MTEQIAEMTFESFFNRLHDKPELHATITTFFHLTFVPGFITRVTIKDYSVETGRVLIAADNPALDTWYTPNLSDMIQISLKGD